MSARQVAVKKYVVTLSPEERERLEASALTGTDPLSLRRSDPADARLLVNDCGSRKERPRLAAAFVSFFVWQEDRFFAPA